MRPLVVPLLLLSWANLAHAEPLPGFLDGHENERRLPAANLPLDVYRPLAPGLRVWAPLAKQRASLPTNTPLMLHKVRFEGGTVYPLSELREHFQPLMGRQTTFGELQQFTDRLTERYRGDGYLLSYAYLPPQDVSEGRVQVVLVEGYIRDHRLVGDIGPAAAYLEQLLTRLKAERPLTGKTLDRYLGLAERMPGVSIEAELPATDQADGATQLTVRARRRPFDAALTLSDGNRDEPQALLRVSSRSQTRFAERVAASVIQPKGDEQTRYQHLEYSQYLDAEGSQLLVSATRYRSEPNTRVRLDHGRTMTQRRESDRYAVGLRQPVIVAADEWMTVAGHFYAVSEHIEDRPGQGVPSRNNATSLRALSFGGDWRHADPRRLRIVTAGVYQGLDYLGGHSDGDYDLNFLRMRVAGLQSDRLMDNWQGVLSGALYWSDDRLPDSERAVFGGQNFGRGYPRDQAAGDRGWGMAYELNYSFQLDGALLRQVQPYGVLDSARAWYNSGHLEDSKLSAVALGVRLGDGRRGSVALEVAKPLADVALDSLDRGPRWTLTFSFQP